MGIEGADCEGGSFREAHAHLTPQLEEIDLFEFHFVSSLEFELTTKLHGIITPIYHFKKESNKQILFPHSYFLRKWFAQYD